MNPFFKHGIRHLSASSLALYRAEPTLWTMQYLFGIRGEFGAAVWRSSAVKGAVNLLMLSDASLDTAISSALKYFDLEAQGEVSDKIEKERGGLPGFVEQAYLQLKPLGKPTGSRKRSQLFLDSDFEGVEMEVPITGYADYVWEVDGAVRTVVNLKPTFACPSSPKTDHSIDISFHHMATGATPKLCYATPKKGALYDIDPADIEQWRWALTRSAFALRQVLSRSRNRNEVLSIFSPDFDNFRWDDRLIDELRKIYAGGPTRPKFAVDVLKQGYE